MISKGLPCSSLLGWHFFFVLRMAEREWRCKKVTSNPHVGAAVSDSIDLCDPLSALSTLRRLSLLPTDAYVSVITPRPYGKLATRMVPGLGAPRAGIYSCLATYLGGDQRPTTRKTKTSVSIFAFLLGSPRDKT